VKTIVDRPLLSSSSSSPEGKKKGEEREMSPIDLISIMRTIIIRNPIIIAIMRTINMRIIIVNHHHLQCL
jgi:hypothetical protein